MNNKIFALGVVAIVVVGIVTSWLFHFEMSKRPEVKEVQESREVGKTNLSFTGKIVPKKTADLGFEKGGRITDLKYAVGATVTEGEPLAYVNDSDLKAQYRQAQEMVQGGQSTLEQYQELVKKEKAKLSSLKKQKTGVNSADKKAQDNQIDASEAQVSAQENQISAAEDNVENIKAQIDKTVILAPFSGIITKQNVEVGETAQSNVPIITLASQSEFKIEAYVSEVDYKNLHVGDAAKIALDGRDPSQTYSAKVTGIDPAETVINNVSNYKITLEFDGMPSDLASGNGANITIDK